MSSCLSAVGRRSIPVMLWAALGCGGTACATLPKAEVTVKTLKSGSTVVDSSGRAFDLPAAAAAAQHPNLCLTLDTLEYEFRPRAEPFHPLPLTDTTVYLRNAVAQNATPIVLKAVLVGERGKRVDGDWGSYVPNNGMDTPENRQRLMSEAGENVCLGWKAVPGGDRYTRLRLSSTRPIVVHDLTWHYNTGS